MHASWNYFREEYNICYSPVEFRNSKILVTKNRIYTNHRYIFTHVSWSLSIHWILKYDSTLGLKVRSSIYLRFDRLCISKFDHIYHMYLKVWLYMDLNVWSPMCLEVIRSCMLELTNTYEYCISYTWIYDSHSIFSYMVMHLCTEYVHFT